MPLTCGKCEVARGVVGRATGKEYRLDHICDESPAGLRWWAHNYRRLADALIKATRVRQREAEEHAVS